MGIPTSYVLPQLALGSPSHNMSETPLTGPANEHPQFRGKFLTAPGCAVRGRHDRKVGRNKSRTAQQRSMRV